MKTLKTETSPRGFDYAKRVISNKVLNYILKPIDINEFLKVISEVMQLCSREKEDESKIKKLNEGYNKVLLYEKEKLLQGIINGARIDEGFKVRLNKFRGRFCIMLNKIAEIYA